MAGGFDAAAGRCVSLTTKTEALSAEDAKDAEEGQEQKSSRKLKPGTGDYLRDGPAFSSHMFFLVLVFLCVLRVLCGESPVLVFHVALQLA
jgi:hypothetical protein